jgi:hypothetical protein
MPRERSARRIPVEDTEIMSGTRMRELMEQLGVRVEDMTWMLGVRQSEWSKATLPPPQTVNTDGAPILDSNGNPRKPREDQRNAPWDDPTTSILARFLERYPQCSLIPPRPNVRTVMDRIRDETGTEVSSATFSIALGRERSTASRWLKKLDEDSSGTSGTINHALAILTKALDDPNIGEFTMDAWTQCVEEEAASRGIDDVWAQGWPGKRKKADYDEAAGD